MSALGTAPKGRGLRVLFALVLLAYPDEFRGRRVSLPAGPDIGVVSRGTVIGHDHPVGLAGLGEQGVDGPVQDGWILVVAGDHGGDRQAVQLGALRVRHGEGTLEPGEEELGEHEAQAERPHPEHPALARGDQAQGVPVQEDRAGHDHDDRDDGQRPARPEGDAGNLEAAAGGYGSIAGFPRRKNSRTVTVRSRVAHAEIPNTIQITAPNPGPSFTKFPPIVCVKRRIIIVGRHDPGNPPQE